MGTKKLGIKQLEKQQAIRELRAKGLWGKRETAREKQARGIEAPSPDDPAFLNEIAKMKVITPYAIASRHDIKLGVAKKLLRELEQRGVIKPIIKCSRIPIYQPVTG